jgi:ParB/RepB/Spo0J family partition protein
MSPAKPLARGVPSRRVSKKIAPNSDPILLAHSVVSVPFNLIELTPLNPRTLFDEAEIDGLAASIQAHGGLLQNFVVRPHPSKPGHFEVAAGGKRHRALSKLVAGGHIPPDFLVPAQIRELSDLELVRVALTENAARSDLHELEEGESILLLCQNSRRGEGATQEIAQALGRSRRWVQTRKALVERLSPRVKQAFRERRVTFAVVRSLLPAPHEEQDQLLENHLSGFLITAEEVAQEIQAPTLPSLAAARFALESYTGPVLGEDSAPLDQQFFGDLEAFRRLQEPALDQLLQSLESRYAWVAVEKHCKDLSLNRRLFTRNVDPSLAGAVVLVSDLLEVALYEGLSRVDARVKPRPAAAIPASRPRLLPPVSQVAGGGSGPGDIAGAEETSSPSGGPIIPEDITAQPSPTPRLTGVPRIESESASRPKFTSLHLLAAQRRKTDRIKAALVEQPHQALRLACVALLGGRTACLLRTEAPALCDQVRTPVVAKALARLRCLLPTGSLPDETLDRPYPYFAFKAGQEQALWPALLALAEADVRALFAALLAPACGSFTSYVIALGDQTPALLLAEVLQLEHGTFTEADLEGWLIHYRKADLIEVAASTGAIPSTLAARQKLRGLKLAEIRELILKSPTRNRDWVPPELHFGTTETLHSKLSIAVSDTAA